MPNTPPKEGTTSSSTVGKSHDQSMSELIIGYQRFRSQSYKVHEATYRTLGRGGQQPPVLVVACADSRCDPSVIFDSPPGELFTIRNVGEY